MKISVCLFLLLRAGYFLAFDVNGAPLPCFSEVYCYGPLLEMVQMSRIFNDSKTFVDMKMRSPPEKILTNYYKFMAEHNNHPEEAEVRRFVEDNFEPSGQELMKWKPEDWKPNPNFLNKTKNNSLKQFGHYLNKRWKDLGRKINEDVLLRPDLYSIIWVPNPVIVPGGRFQEFHYWDSYWIIQGLLLSEMFTTVRGMLENFLYIIKKHGHIPNGGRVYYLERSQPPLLIPMVKLYFDATEDLDFLEKNIEILESEFDYWFKNRTVKVELQGKSYTVAAYGENSQGPRPESYYEDFMHAKNFEEEHDKRDSYSETNWLVASGWKPSNRWFIPNGIDQGNLTIADTRSIIPVDLNAILFWNAKLLGEFNEILGGKDKSKYFTQKAEDWLNAVTDVFWHEDLGIWLDYDLQTSTRRDQFYPTNIAPLWTGCLAEKDTARMVEGVVQYLSRQNIWNYYGGMPTLLLNNRKDRNRLRTIPSFLHMLVVGLRNTRIREAGEFALKLVAYWIWTLEEYNSNELDGDEDVNGCTSGVILDFLNRYGNEIISDQGKTNNFTLKEIHLFAEIISVVTLIVIFFIICMLWWRKKRQGYMHDTNLLETESTEILTINRKNSSVCLSDNEDK